MKLTTITIDDNDRARRQLQRDYGREPSSLEVVMHAIELAERREQQDLERAKRQAEAKRRQA
jgi:hypothetical protein